MCPRRLPLTLAVLLAAGASAACASLDPPSRPQRLHGFDAPDPAAAEQLRRVGADEARRTARGVGRCERVAASTGHSERVAAYRGCAVGPLGRAAASAGVNGRMLLELAGTGRGTCSSLAAALAGDTAVLGAVARTTLAGATAQPWHEVRAGSRAVQRLAQEVLAAATAPGWATACRL